MKTKLLRIALALIIAVGAGALTSSPASAGGPSTQAVSCNSGLIANHPQSGGFINNNTLIMSGPAIYCAFNGYGHRTHTVIYYCWVFADDGSWTYLRDVTTGVFGWVKDSELKNSGSGYIC